MNTEASIISGNPKFPEAPKKWWNLCENCRPRPPVGLPKWVVAEATVNEERKVWTQISHVLETPTRIALVGGGTGGHVIPIVALTGYMREQKMDAQFLWIGESESMEERFARENSIDFESIASYRIPSMRSIKMIPALFSLIKGIFQARTILKQFRPDSLFSKGWPGAISVVLAARTLRIPVYIHDSDIIPGISNRSIAKFSDHIFLGCPEAGSYFKWKKTTTVGQLLSPKLLLKNEKPTVFFHSSDKTRVLVICGSQGSTSIYNELGEIIPDLPEFEFIISLGTRNESFAEKFSLLDNVHAEAWLGDDLWDLYREADVIISRGSITTLAEAIAFGAKVIAIPLPIAAFDHQRANVRSYEKQGLVTGLEESDLSKLKDILRSFAGRREYVAPRYDILEGVKKVSAVLIAHE